MREKRLVIRVTEYELLQLKQEADKALTSNKMSRRVLKWLVGYCGSGFDGGTFYFLDLPKRGVSNSDVVRAWIAKLPKPKKTISD